jgi:predicted ATP-grasp superfamily ATP-dependent carboligase
VTLKGALGILDVPSDRFRKLLVMEYLPGPEYSLDCLARKGDLLAVTIRQKPLLPGRPERLVFNPALEGVARVLASRFGLDSVSNIQLRDSENGHRLLEINPRMAGGLYFSCLGGLNYPYWAVRLALSDCREELPAQRSGLSVAQAPEPFVYG